MSAVKKDPSFIWRICTLAGICGIFFLTLLSSLALRQFVESSQYRDKEERQTKRRILQPAPRGEIYDREGRLLVGNQSRHSAVIYLEQIRKEFRAQYLRDVRDVRALREPIHKGMTHAKVKEHLGPFTRHEQDHNSVTLTYGKYLKVIFQDSVVARTTVNSSDLQWEARLAVVRRYLDQVNRITGRSDTISRRKFERHFNRKLLLPFTLVPKLTAEEYARLLDQLPLDSPVQIFTDSTRFYPYHSAASHSLGYVVLSEVEDEAEKLAGQNLKTFRLKGKQGKTGLELSFNDRLDGTPGGEIWRVDPMGFQFELEKKQLPTFGQSIQTSLDIDLQMLAEEQITHKKAAVVALDVQTGEVLALASKPGYNLNDLTPYISTNVYRRIESEGGWLPRATQGLYPPGSTFKILTTIAAMRQGHVHGETQFECKGVEFIGLNKDEFLCHNPRGHLSIKIQRALALSCNTYFYHYGVRTGIDHISTEARRFGLHAPTGVQLPYETRGMVIPDKEWKKERHGEPWRPGDTANSAIGQGYILVTPLQMACFTASIARGETRTRPTILHIPDKERAAIEHGGEPIGLTNEQTQQIFQGMEKAVQFGTAQLCKIPGIRIAAKTGTAEVNDSDRNSPTFGQALTLAWFIGFAPVEKPSIAIAICVEGTDPKDNYQGGTTAAPIARNLFWTYFAKKSQQELTQKP